MLDLKGMYSEMLKEMYNRYEIIDRSLNAKIEEGCSESYAVNGIYREELIEERNVLEKHIEKIENLLDSLK